MFFSVFEYCVVEAQGCRMGGLPVNCWPGFGSWITSLADSACKPYGGEGNPTLRPSSLFWNHSNGKTIVLFANPKLPHWMNIMQSVPKQPEIKDRPGNLRSHPWSAGPRALQWGWLGSRWDQGCLNGRTMFPLNYSPILFAAAQAAAETNWCLSVESNRGMRGLETIWTRLEKLGLFSFRERRQGSRSSRSKGHLDR